jgi:hypothetical protein
VILLDLGLSENGVYHGISTKWQFFNGEDDDKPIVSLLICDFWGIHGYTMVYIIIHPFQAHPNFSIGKRAMLLDSYIGNVMQCNVT